MREKELMDDFTRRIAREQFALGRMQVGAVALPEIFPVLEGQMVPIEEIPKMVQDGKLENTAAEEIERKYDQFRQEFTVVYRKTLSLSRELASEMSYLEQEAASVLVDGVIEELKEKYPSAQISEYLEEVRHHVLDNLDPFKEREGEEEQPPSEGGGHARAGTRRARSFPRLRRERDPGARRARKVPGDLRNDPHLRESFRHGASQLRSRAAAGTPISWTCAAARSCALTADSW